MFETLPEKFRSHHLPADVRTLLILQKAMQKGLVQTLGDIYSVLRGVLVKDPQMMGPFTQAFYDYFLHIDIKKGETLNDAIVRSDTFKQWKNDNWERFGDGKEQDENLVNTFLDQVHLTTYDIKEIIDGKELWDKDRGDLADKDTPNPNKPQQPASRHLDKMADYSKLSLEELMQRMEEVLKQQKTEHSGGSHWVGTGGISPYGHGGAAKDGIRVGGSGGGKMARKVMGDSHFFPVDKNALLNDNNIDAALAALKGIEQASWMEKLDIENTINKGLKRGGLFLPELKNEQENKLQVLLLIDNGGYSMSPYIQAVQTLFKKMKTRFSHDMETYYFHNTVYNTLYSDERRSKPISIDKILAKDPNYRVFFVGDAAMAPYEIDKVSLQTYKNINAHFKKTAWLNPEPPQYWAHTFTTQVIAQYFDMYPLTPQGIEKAVQALNRKY